MIINRSDHFVYTEFKDGSVHVRLLNVANTLFKPSTKIARYIYDY